MLRRALTPLLLASTLALACATTTAPCPEPAEAAHAPSPAPAATTPAPLGPLRVAITIDDLPAHGPLSPGESQLSVHAKLLEVLDAHGVPGAYGFVNAAKLERVADGRAVLELWRDRGHPLGNHTFSHANINEVGVAAFIADIERNDAVLADIMGDSATARRSRRAFRYPYLRQGADAATLDAVRDYLRDNGYQLAEVTVDFGDWAYNAPYARCRARGDEDAIADLRWSFVANGVGFLRWSDRAARALYGRRIPHVLLLHSGSFDAAVLDDLLTAYEHIGVEWITLDAALADPAYQEDVRAPSKYGGTLLEQRIELAEGDEPGPEPETESPPPFMIQPVGLLQNVCPPARR